MDLALGILLGFAAGVTATVALMRVGLQRRLRRHMRGGELLCPYDSHHDDCDCRGMGGDR